MRKKVLFDLDSIVEFALLLTGWYPAMEVPSLVYWAYAIQCSFYLHCFFATIFLDVWRKDSFMLIMHHVLTLNLIGFSYASRLVDTWHCIFTYLLTYLSGVPWLSGLVHRTCGFESWRRPWCLCPWARHLTIIASLQPRVYMGPLRVEMVIVFVCKARCATHLIIIIMIRARIHPQGANPETPGQAPSLSR